MENNNTCYVITPSDLSFARTYLRRKSAMYPNWIETVDAHTSLPDSSRDAITLSRWCQQWLNPEQWQQLKAAIRAARYRRRQHSSARDPDVHVRLTRRAWKMLSDLAQRDGVTLSDFIVRQHQEAWFDLEPLN